jgi:hypothetical protein
MYKYKVRVKPVDSTEPGAFVGIKYISAAFDGWDNDGNEIHEIVAETDISRYLDLSDGVIDYKEL